MRRVLARVSGALLVVVAAIGVVFVAGMRSKSPVVLRTVRRTSRAMKPLVLKTAGSPGVGTSVIRHVGRTTGQSYETPVGAVETEDGFVIALPYGPDTDWLKNVLAHGSATVVHEGRTHTVDQPDVVPLEQANRYFSAADQRAHRWFNVGEGLRLRRVSTEPKPATVPADQS